MDRRTFLIASTALAGTAALHARSSGSNGGTSSPEPPTSSEPGACSSAEAQATGGVVPGPSGVELPLAPSGTVIKVGARDNYYAANSYTTNPEVWKEIEARTGVTVDWDVTAPGDYNDAFMPRIAAGRDLPDLYRLPDGLDPVELGINGAILPLNDLIEQHGPNIIKNIFEPYPLIEKLLTAPDGNIYNLTQLVVPGSYADPYGLNVRKDWLDQLGLTEPSTLDEWYNALKAFKTENPSGSGNGDEIPMIASNGLNSLGVFGNAYGLHIFSNGLSSTAPDASGQLIYELTDPRYQALLVWLNKLFEENLLDPEWYRSDSATRLQRVTNNLVGASQNFTNETVTFNLAQAEAGHPEAEWIQAAPPISEIDQSRYYELYGPTSDTFVVANSAQEPALLMKWLDYVWASDEGNTLVTYGLEGVTYTVGADDRLTFTDWVSNNPEGLDPNSALRYYGALPNVPFSRMNAGTLSGFDWEVTRTNPGWYEQAKAVECYQVPPANLPILGTPEESQEMAEITPDLFTYQSEMNTKFVLGQEDPTSGWESYLQTLDELGLPRYRDILQQRYDRFQQ